MAEITSVADYPTFILKEQGHTRSADVAVLVSMREITLSKNQTNHSALLTHAR
jgi:hypothetical protein